MTFSLHRQPHRVKLRVGGSLVVSALGARQNCNGEPRISWEGR